MFPYDAALLNVLATNPASMADVLTTMHAIDALCIPGDGLKWFNWLYMSVTEAVETRVSASGFTDTAWIAELDVQFARFYFQALKASLTGQPAPSCWQILFHRRSQADLARIQFALAGINAHINHDLPLAIVKTWEATKTQPERAIHYTDYTSLNPTLDNLIETAKQTLRVRLLGALLPPVSHVEDVFAAWKVAGARELAWKNATHLWQLRAAPPLAGGFAETLDSFTTVIGEALVVPIPAR